MSLLKVREQRKKLGAGTKRGAKTITLLVLLVLVFFIMFYLDRA
jgi:hypothetical protein